MIQQLLASFGASGASYPHVADANARLSLTAEGVVVSGAGLATVNATYTQRGTVNGKPYYNQTSYATDTATAVIYWSDDNKWKIKAPNGDTEYESTDAVAYPWLVTTWTLAGDGSNPVPTVTHQSGQVTGAGYRVIQDDDGLTYEFQGDGADADAGLWVSGAGTTSWNRAYLGPPDHGTDYFTIPSGDPPVADAGSGNWVMGGDYSISAQQTYPWLDGWSIFGGAGDPPPPNVIRNPVASEANWTIVP